MRVAIEDGIRGAIRSGRLIPGTRLPATGRWPAIGVSRGTVLQAYDQLVAEGWLRGRRGSSTVVIAEAEAHRQSTAIREPPPVRWRYDLRPGRPDAGSFPRAEWLRAVRRALATAPNAAFGYDSPQGQLPLRVEAGGLPEPGPRSSRLAGGRGGHRRLHPGPGLVARSLAATGVRAVAMEEPSMPLHRSIVRAAGLEIILTAVDGDGMRVDALEGSAGLGGRCPPPTGSTRPEPPSAHHAGPGSWAGPARREP